MKSARTRKINFLRKELPYGKHICTNGAEILFNRDYEVLKGDVINLAQYDSETVYFYNDSNPPWNNANTREKCTKLLIKN